MNKNSISIGLFGLGTVGTGVMELIQKNQAILKNRLGKSIEIKKVVTRNPNKPRKIDLTNIQINSDFDFILKDPDIDVVVELIGGTQDANYIVSTALQNNKSVVTANKALIAEKSLELANKLIKSKSILKFEASVAGSIPILRSITEGFSGDQIGRISGIMNGTANYILSKMTEEGLDFSDVLQDAQEKGYAEADPTFDIEGMDTAHKLIILMNLSFNQFFDYHSLYIEGITKIEKQDIEYAKELGYRIKLLGKAQKKENTFEARVHPTLIRENNLLSSVNEANNAISVQSDFAGNSLFYGAGAGACPTASAVVADIVDISKNLVSNNPHFKQPTSNDAIHYTSLAPIDSIECEYYLRFSVLDEKGVLGKITTLLGEHFISIQSVIQKTTSDHSSEPVTLIIVTHKAKEQNMQQALQMIQTLNTVKKYHLIRIDS